MTSLFDDVIVARELNLRQKFQFSKTVTAFPGLVGILNAFYCLFARNKTIWFCSKDSTFQKTWFWLIADPPRAVESKAFQSRCNKQLSSDKSFNKLESINTEKKIHDEIIFAAVTMEDVVYKLRQVISYG